jgi:hypothetical protein
MKVQLMLLAAIAVYFAVATSFGSLLVVGSAGPVTP